MVAGNKLLFIDTVPLLLRYQNSILV